MPKKRQILLVKPTAAAIENPSGRLELEPLGSLREVTKAVSAYNTAPDGAGKGSASGLAVLYGPGFVMEVPTSGDEINQAMVTLIEEDIAFQVLMRLCKGLKWRMMDPESGRTFG